MTSHQADTFSFPARLYDRSINWAARIKREIPVLLEVFGPPANGGLIDAGCGTGRQARVLAERGYRVTGVDASEEMLDLAREHAGLADESVTFVPSTYADLPRAVSGGADGLYCLGNALAAAGSRQAVAEAMASFAACLRPGGRLFIQVLNFEPMRAEGFCVRGPRVSVVDGRELVSVRHFHCARDTAEVTNITLFNEDGWRMRSHRGTLYPLRLDELRGWCAENGLRVDDVWGGYDRQPLDPKTSIDLILVATRE